MKNISVTVTRGELVVGTLDGKVNDETQQLVLDQPFGYTAALPSQKGDIFKAADGREWMNGAKGNDLRQTEPKK